VEAARVGRPAEIAGEPGHGSGRDVGQNDEGAKGNRFTYLPWAVVARGGGFPGRRRTGGGMLGGGGAPVFREEEARLVAVRGEVENAAGSFYSRGEDGNSAGALLASHVRPTMVEEAVREGSGVDSAGGIRGRGVNAVLLDGICRSVSACEPAVSGAARCGAAVGVRRRCWRGDDGSTQWSNGGSSARSLHGAGEVAVIGWLGSDTTRRAVALQAGVRGTVHVGAARVPAGVARL
jgi:hypothetical protein